MEARILAPQASLLRVVASIRKDHRDDRRKPSHSEIPSRGFGEIRSEIEEVRFSRRDARFCRYQSRDLVSKLGE